MDGLTMAEKVRCELGNQDVRIVMLTTEGNPKLRERGKAVGVNGWIVKPFKGQMHVLRRQRPAAQCRGEPCREAGEFGCGAGAGPQCQEEAGLQARGRGQPAGRP